MKHPFQIFDGYWKENFTTAMLAMVIQMDAEARDTLVGILLARAGWKELVPDGLTVLREAPVRDESGEPGGRLDLLLTWTDACSGLKHALGVEVKLWGYGQSEDELAEQLGKYQAWLSREFDDSRLLFLAVEPLHESIKDICNGWVLWSELCDALGIVLNKSEGFRARFLGDVHACLEEATTDFTGFDTLHLYTRSGPDIDQNEGWGDVYEFLGAIRRSFGELAGNVTCEDYQGDKAEDGWNYSGATVAIWPDDTKFHSVGLYWFLEGGDSHKHEPGGFFCVFREDEDEVISIPIAELLARTQVSGWFAALEREIRTALKLSR